MLKPPVFVPSSVIFYLIYFLILSRQMTVMYITRPEMATQVSAVKWRRFAFTSRKTSFAAPIKGPSIISPIKFAMMITRTISQVIFLKLVFLFLGSSSMHPFECYNRGCHLWAYCAE